MCVLAGNMDGGLQEIAGTGKEQRPMRFNKMLPRRLHGQDDAMEQLSLSEEPGEDAGTASPGEE